MLFGSNSKTSVENSKGKSALIAPGTKQQVPGVFVKTGAENLTEVLTGIIEDIRTNRVTIRLDSGEIINCRIQGMNDLRIGEKKSFAVKEYDAETNTIVLSGKADDELYGAEKAVRSALESANISPTEKNMDIAQELLSKGMVLSEKNIRKYMLINSKYPDIDIKTVIRIEAEGVSLSDEALLSLSEYYNDSHTDKIEMSGNTKNYISYAEKAIDEFVKKLNEMPVGEEKQSIMDEIVRNVECVRKELLGEESTDKSKTSADGNVKESSFDNVSNALGLQSAKTEESFTRIAELLKGIVFFNPKDIGLKDKRKLDIENSLNCLRYLSAVSREITKKNAGNVKSTWEKTENENSVESYAAKSFSRNPALNGDISSLLSYIKLPIKLAGQNTHAELFVRRNKKESGTGNVYRASLHLNMERLKHVDVYIVLASKSLKLNFVFEEKEVCDYMKNEMSELVHDLSEKGYLVKTEVKVDEKMNEKEPLDRFVEYTGNTDDKIKMQRYSFDIRA